MRTAILAGGAHRFCCSIKKDAEERASNLNPNPFKRLQADEVLPEPSRERERESEPIRDNRTGHSSSH